MNSLFLRKCLAIVLAVAFLATCLPTAAYAADLTEFGMESLDEDVEEIDFDPGLDDEEIQESENVNTVFNYETSEAILDPQYTYEDEVNCVNAGSTNGGISLFSIADEKENTDLTIQLDGMTDSAARNEGNNGNLKCLIPRSTIMNYVKQAFSNTVVKKGYTVVMQGGCSDNQYMFFAFTVYDGSVKDDKQIGLFFVCCHFGSGDKIVVDCYRSSKDNSKLSLLDHANCLTYNSLKDQVVVACADDNNQTVCTINASYLRGKSNTLSLKKHYISCCTSSIAYNASLNRYVVNVKGKASEKVKNRFCILDSDFNLIAKCKESNDLTTNISHQGFCCDNTYVYALYYVSDKTDQPNKKVQNVLAIYTWSGQLVKEINLSFNRRNTGEIADTFEMENIFMMNNKVFLGLNCSYSMNGTTRARHYYYYDLSSKFFHIQYCPDEDVQKHLNSGSKTMSHVFYGISTPIQKNSFTKTGYKFAGWTLYIPGEDIWSYKNSDGTIKWCKAGTQPAGYSKTVYTNKQSVSQTVKSGKTVMFCANWAGTKTFHVAFNANGGSGSMPSQTVTYGTSKTMPKNAFTKSGRTFKGWQIYNSDRGLWLYQSADGAINAWYKEGAAPAGYKKRLYSNGTTIAKTAPAGQHLVFYAQWNEYTIYYSANGAKVKPSSVLPPTNAVYGSSNTVRKYTADSTKEKRALKGYNQHRLELDKWRYQNRSNADDTPWFNKNSVDTDKYKLYLFTGTTVKQTVQVGEHVVFRAQWA